MFDKDLLDRMRVKVNRPSDKKDAPSTEKILSILRSKGLERIAEPVLKFRTLPPLEDEPALGASKLGGNPDLPIGIPWPTWDGRPLDFLLQLDLTEIPRHLVDDALPERGWLYFFYDLERSRWGFDVSHRFGWRVLFYDGDRKNLGRRKRPDFTDPELRSCGLVFFEGIYLNWPSLKDKKSLDDLRYLYKHENLFEADVEISGHQITGRTHGGQGMYEDMQEECQLVSNGSDLWSGGGPGFAEGKTEQVKTGIKDWRLLLELDSDQNAGLEWTGYGTLYFWIREEDLRSCEFNNLWAIFECF